MVDDVDKLPVLLSLNRTSIPLLIINSCNLVLPSKHHTVKSKRVVPFLDSMFLVHGIDTSVKELRCAEKQGQNFETIHGQILQ